MSRTRDFVDPPHVSGVELEKRIDVAAYWLVREHLRIKGHEPLLLIFPGNSFKIMVTDDRNWYDTEDLPYCNIAFWEGYAEVAATDGSVGDDGKDELTVQRLEYADPNLPENAVQVVRDWYQRVLDIGRFPEATGRPDELIYCERPA